MAYKVGDYIYVDDPQGFRGLEGTIFEIEVIDGVNVYHFNTPIEKHHFSAPEHLIDATMRKRAEQAN